MNLNTYSDNVNAAAHAVDVQPFQLPQYGKGFQEEKTFQRPAEQLRNTDKQRDECSRAVHELGNQFQTSKLGFLGRTRRGIAEKHDMSSAVAACFYVLHAVVPSNQHANLSRVSIVIVAVILSLGVGDYCVRHLLYAAN